MRGEGEGREEGLVGFDHERLEVYRRAVELVGVVEEAVRSVPPSHSGIAGQLRRAVSSVVLNIAEGASEYSRKEKTRFYRFARRSVAEVRAGFDVMVATGVLKPERLRQLDDLAGQVSRMLHALVRPSPSPSPSPPSPHPHPHPHPHPEY
jgi:four helix bundle protein